MIVRSLIGLVIVLSAFNVIADDYPFGRLFTDDKERVYLDRVRSGREQAEPEPERPVTKVVQPEIVEAGTSRIRFSGYSKRSDGHTVFWVDGRTNLEASTDESARLIEDGNEAVFTSEEKSTRLRPGQTWYVDEDAVADVYQSGPPDIESIDGIESSDRSESVKGGTE